MYCEPLYRMIVLFEVVILFNMPIEVLQWL